MTKIWEIPLMVTEKTGTPITFTWRGQNYKIAQVVDKWKDTGSWWTGEGEKVFYRLETQDKGLWEIYYDLKKKRWVLYRTYD
ncbi:MAG: DUF6504 family protein [Bacillota bacterium]